MSTGLPSVPARLVSDTDDLLRKLDSTLENLRAFTARLHAATASTRDSEEQQ